MTVKKGSTGDIKFTAVYKACKYKVTLETIEENLLQRQMTLQNIHMGKK